MGILDYFKPVQAMSAEQVRSFLNETNAGEYTLIDVRQPREYERGHIPGAVLIPVGQLGDRIDEIDQSKPAVVY